MLDNTTCKLNLSFESLPSAEEYKQADHSYLDAMLRIPPVKWSEAKYRCPVCNEGGMRRDETIVCASNPPSYRYECDRCHHVTYHHI